MESVNSISVFFRKGAKNTRLQVKPKVVNITSYDESLQEPMTRSLQLPYWAYVTAFLQTDLFLDYLFRKKQRQFRFGDPMASA